MSTDASKTFVMIYTSQQCSNIDWPRAAGARQISPDAGIQKHRRMDRVLPKWHGRLTQHDHDGELTFYVWMLVV